MMSLLVLFYCVHILLLAKNFFQAHAKDFIFLVICTFLSFTHNPLLPMLSVLFYAFILIENEEFVKMLSV